MSKNVESKADRLKCSVSSSHVISRLNEFLLIDRKAISELVLSKRVRCNERLSCHSTVQVVGKRLKGGKGWIYEVGFLGVLNSLFGVNKWAYGRIYADVNERSGLINHFGDNPLAGKPADRK